MSKFIIERDIPGIGSADQDTLRESSKLSNSIITDMNNENKNIQWEHSYVTSDKMFCIYIADNESLIEEHATRSGFPATKITQVRCLVSPATADEKAPVDEEATA